MVEQRLLTIRRENEQKDNAPVWRVINHTHKKEAFVISYFDTNARPYFYRTLFDVSGLEGFETANLKETTKSKEKPFIYPIINGEKKTEFKNELRPREFVLKDEKRLNCLTCYNLVRNRKGKDWIGRNQCVSCFSSYSKSRDTAISPVKI